MKASIIIDDALTKLGLNHIGSDDAKFQKISLNALNSVYRDAFYRNNKDGAAFIETPADDVDLPERVCLDVLPFGVAAFIAASLGDGEKQQFFSGIYNQKRKSILAAKKIIDVIPTGE